ncbi:hypothetical protein V1264_017380 [Littorina saxatilis]|uniref:Ig-like domain-containing protein n=1 Tax=Littorina saxatilis TaxID=31220 RepID=A0AAN9GF51_9CAEN
MYIPVGPPESPPEITGINQNEVLTEGDNRILSCTVAGGDPQVDRITFFCGDKRGVHADTSPVESRVKVLTSTVTFAHVKADNNGLECQCYASWSGAPELTAKRSSFTLKVLATSEKQKLPVVAIAAGAGAVLVVVAIVVTVIVVVVVAKRRKNSHGHDGTKARKREDVDEYQNGQYANTASNRFEEDAEDETSFNYASVSPAGAKPTNQQSQYNNAGAKPTNQQSQYNNLGGNLYSTPEEADEENPTHAASPAVQIQDEYAVVNKPGAQGKQEHQADVYAVVEKTNKQQGAAEPQAATDEYAVVQKTKSPTCAEPQADVYAVVQKSK